MNLTQMLWSDRPFVPSGHVPTPLRGRWGVLTNTSYEVYATLGPDGMYSLVLESATYSLGDGGNTRNWFGNIFTRVSGRSDSLVGLWRLGNAPNAAAVYFREDGEGSFLGPYGRGGGFRWAVTIDDGTNLLEYSQPRAIARFEPETVAFTGLDGGTTIYLWKYADEKLVLTPRDGEGATVVLQGPPK